MKNASLYEKKIKKLLNGIKKSKASNPPEGSAAIAEVIQAILQPDTFVKHAREGYENLVKDFVDFNELRVSPPKEIIERLGRNFPEAREKADTLILVLNRMFDQTCTMTMSYMEKIARKDLRRHLLELGMSPYSAAYVLLTVFGQHAVPVDRSLVESLEMEEYVEPGSSVTDVQSLLEKVVQQGYAMSAHEFLRGFTEKNLKMFEKRRAAAQAKADAEAYAKANEAAAKAKADAAAKAKAEAAAKAKADAAAAKAKADEKASEAAEKAQSKRNSHQGAAKHSSKVAKPVKASASARKKTK